MTEQLRPLPSDLADAIFEIGGRKLDLVQGPDDAEVLEEWYIELLPEILFHPAGGWPQVARLLTSLGSLRPDVEAYGIRDRDFLSDEEVGLAVLDPQSRLFVLRRFSIENYLLEPSAVYQVAQKYLGRACHIKNSRDVETELYRLCLELKPLTSANWSLIELGANKLAAGFQIARGAIVSAVASELACTMQEAEALVSAKESQLTPKLADLDTAHTVTSGKSLLTWIYVWVRQPKHALSPEHFRRLLAERIKIDNAIHVDIRHIVETRILGIPASEP